MSAIGLYVYLKMQIITIRVIITLTLTFAPYKENKIAKKLKYDIIIRWGGYE